jgi:amino acid transporter
MSLKRDKKAVSVPDLGIATDIQMRKSLNKLELLFLSLQGVIGSGWLFASLYTAAYTGGSAIIAWIIGGLMLLPIALTYSEIASIIPKSGGVIRYPHYTHGGLLGYIISWSYFAAGATVPAIEATAVVTYLSSLFPQLTVNGYLTTYGILLAYGLIFLFFIINYLGVSILGKVAHGVGWWKLIIPSVAVILLLSFYYNPSNFTAGGGLFPSPSNLATSYYGMAAVLYSIPATGILFAYTGFRQAIEYGSEAKNPKKDIPFAVVGAVLISIVLYTLLQVAFIGAINWSAINVKVGDWGGIQNSILSSGPFYEIFSTAGVSGLVRLIFISFALLLLIDAVVSPSGTTLVGMGSGTRVLYGLASNGYFPEIFLKLGKTRVPVVSLITVTVLGSIFLLPFPAWIALVGIVSSAAVFSYIMGGVSLEVLRKKAPDVNRQFKVPLSKVIAPLSTISALLIVYWSGFITLFEVVTIIFSGIPIFIGYYTRKFWNVKKSVLIPSLAVNIFGIVIGTALFYILTSGLSTTNNLGFIIYIATLSAVSLFDFIVAYKYGNSGEAKAGGLMLFLILASLVLSYFGSFGMYPIIPFPEDLIPVIALGLAFHYLAIKNSLGEEEIREIIKRTTEGLI